MIHLMRGQVYDIGGKTFFTFGGGLSADRADRKEGRSWWPQEAPSGEEMEAARKNRTGTLSDWILINDRLVKLIYR